MLTTLRSRNRRTASALVALAAITMAGGCSSDDGLKAAPSPTRSSAKPTTTESSDEAQARMAVVAAYQNLNSEQIKAYAKASLAGTQVAKYATGKELRDVKDAVFVNMQNGIVFRGEPKITARGIDVVLHLDKSPKQATLRLCFDLNTWEPFYKKTGKSAAAPNQVKRYPITANLQQQTEQWQVTDERADKESKC
ncbi:hypothetical protein JK361_33300 [Streptomyces sp. 5-8]|uniref:Lipoprotein n=1 Tax=Streptomyces musisoli TaxID=2802280 RepID=A0ABS1PBH5_9ACTN|nr:hypothetical protein [Streptomyces musisoli]MBL1109402.1 hypothetical protein [Streptomyces musisoli]